MNYLLSSDEELLDTFKKTQNHHVFSEITRRYEQHVFKKCYSYLKDEDDLRDVSQEVFVRIFSRVNTYRTGAPVKPWLNTIVHNRCIDHIKQDKKAFHQEMSSKIVNTIVEELDVEEVNHPTTEILQEFLGKISGEEKLIFSLKYEQGWSIKAIAQYLKLNENTVKSRLKRTRREIAKTVK